MSFSKDCLQKPPGSSFLLNVLMCDTSKFASLEANPCQTRRPLWRSVALDTGSRSAISGFQSSWPWQMWAPWFCGSCLLQSLGAFTSQATGLQSSDVLPRTGESGRAGLSAALWARCWAAHQEPAWLLLEAGQNGIRSIFFAKSAHSDNVICSSD